MFKKIIAKYWSYCVIVALCIVLIMQYEDYLTKHNEALMVLITAVYLFATIRISYANIESAKATREQLSNSNDNYEDSRHLQIMPYFKAGISNHPEGCIRYDLPLIPSDTRTMHINVIVLSNLGKGPAIDLEYKWKYADVKASSSFGISFVKENDKLKMDIDFHGDLINPKQPGILSVIYCDMLGRQYCQDLTILFDPNTKQVSIDKVETGLITVLKR